MTAKSRVAIDLVGAPLAATEVLIGSFHRVTSAGDRKLAPIIFNTDRMVRSQRLAGTVSIFDWHHHDWRTHSDHVGTLGKSYEYAEPSRMGETHHEPC